MYYSGGESIDDMARNVFSREHFRFAREPNLKTNHLSRAASAALHMPTSSVVRRAREYKRTVCTPLPTRHHPSPATEPSDWSSAVHPWLLSELPSDSTPFTTKDITCAASYMSSVIEAVRQD